MKAKCFAKLNIFLKIVGTQGNYHKISSRFVLYKKLFDTIEFVKTNKQKFMVVGSDIEDNIINRAYFALLEHTKSKKLESFFKEYSVKLIKNIPMGAGLGGGSSNAAAFLNLCNSELKLNLSKDELAYIGKKIGADVAFFIYEIDAANVEGIGEKIQRVEDEIDGINLKLIPIHCNTTLVYKNYRKKYLKFENQLAKKLKEMSSNEILSTIKPLEANDLYKSAIDLCPKLAPFSKDFFLSGSGSTLFRRENENSSNK